MDDCDGGASFPELVGGGVGALLLGLVTASFDLSEVARWPRREVANACVAIGRPQVATEWQEGRTRGGKGERGVGYWERRVTEGGEP